MHLLKVYYEYVNHPARALEMLFKERSINAALLGYLTATFGWVLFFNIGSGLTAFAFLFKLTVLFIAELTAGYFLAAFCGLFLDLSKIKTSPAELFILIGSAGFIKALLIAFALISASVPYIKLGYLAPLALLLVLGLQLGYLTRGIMRAYQIPVGKALTAWIVAFVPALIALGLLGVFLIWGIVLLF